MKKQLNKVLALAIIAGTITSGSYCISPKERANGRRATTLNKQLNYETAKLAEMESNPNATEEAIDKQKKKVEAKKEEALSWIQKTYKSATEMSTPAKALLATAAIATAAVTADWYFGTGYVSGAADWLYNKLPSRETFGFGKKSLAGTQIKNLPGAVLNKVGEIGNKTPAELATEGKKLAKKVAQSAVRPLGPEPLPEELLEGDVLNTLMGRKVQEWGEQVSPEKREYLRQIVTGSTKYTPEGIDPLTTLMSTKVQEWGERVPQGGREYLERVVSGSLED
jgi:hypothetical protein